MPMISFAFSPQPATVVRATDTGSFESLAQACELRPVNTILVDRPEPVYDMAVEVDGVRVNATIREYSLNREKTITLVLDSEVGILFARYDATAATWSFDQTRYIIDEPPTDPRDSPIMVLGIAPWASSD